MSNKNKKSEDANTSEGLILNSENISTSLNDMLSQEQNSNNKILDMSETETETERKMIPNNLINKKNIKETQSLKENKIKNKIKSSSVIQIPQSIRSDNIKNIKYINSTLDESIYATISRDLSMIFKKLKYVINPFISKEMKYYHIRQWDLWGPFLLNIILACTLALNTKEKGQITSLIFTIFWLGGVAIYLNNYFLEVKTSIFQIFCLLGYCLFPLNIAAIIVIIIYWSDIFRLIVVGFSFCWSVYSSSDYLKAITTQKNKRYLVLYPCILFYLYISWFIFATKE